MIVDNVTGIFRRIFAGYWGPRTDDIFRAACLTLLGSVPPGVRAGHPGRHPPAARRRRRPQAPHRRGPRPGPAGLLGLVRGTVPRLPGGRGRAADEQAPRVPAPQVRPRRDRGRPVHLRHEPGPRQRRAVPGPAAQGDPRRGDRPARRRRSSSPAPGRPPPAAPGCPRPPARTPACTSTSARTSSTCPTRWKTCSPRPAPTGSRSPWPTRTSPSSPRTCARASAPTPAPRSSSASPPRTPRDLERHTAPVLTAHDLSHLDAYQAAARLVAGSAETPAFTLRTRPLPPAGPGPGTARPQGGPRRPQRRRRHRAAARRRPRADPGCAAAPDRPSRRRRTTPCLHCPPCPAAPAPPGGWPAARSWPPRSPPGSPPATGGCCACCTSTAS